MLKIRLQRIGRKNHAEFRVVVTEHTRGPKSANYLEVVGAYNPHTNEVTLDKERVLHWMKEGAQASDTVHNMLVKQKIIDAPTRNPLPQKTPVKKESTENAAEGKADVGASAPQENPQEDKEEEKKEEVNAQESPAEEEKEKVETSA